MRQPQSFAAFCGPADKIISLRLPASKPYQGLIECRRDFQGKAHHGGYSLQGRRGVGYAFTVSPIIKVGRAETNKIFRKKAGFLCAAFTGSLYASCFWKVQQIARGLLPVFRQPKAPADTLT